MNTLENIQLLVDFKGFIIKLYIETKSILLSIQKPWLDYPFNILLLLLLLNQI